MFAIGSETRPDQFGVPPVFTTHLLLGPVVTGTKVLPLRPFYILQTSLRQSIRFGLLEP